MAGGQLALPNQVPHRFRQFEQAQAVGHVAAAFADDIAEIVLRVTVFGNQLLVAKRLIEGIEVGTLDIFNNGQFQRGAIIHIANEHRDLDQSGALRRPPAPFTGDDLVAPVAGRPHHNGLHNTVLVDGAGKIFQLFRHGCVLIGGSLKPQVHLIPAVTSLPLSLVQSQKLPAAFWMFSKRG